MKSLPQKKTESDFVEAAGAYDIIGIDRKKCRMPVVDDAPDVHGQRLVLTGPGTLGYFIATELQPSLEALARAAVLEKTAPFLDSNIDAIQQSVANNIARLAILSPHSPDKEGVKELIEKLGDGTIHTLPETTQQIAAEVAVKLTDKVRVAAAAMDASRSK